MRFWRIVREIIIIIVIFVAHIIAANILPYPLNHLNIIFLSLFLLTIFGSRRQIIWYALALLFLSELFGSAPFGVNTAALLIALIALNWVLLNVFTNRTFVVVALSSLLTFFLYRLAYIAILSAVYIFTELGTVSITSAMWFDYGVEILINAAVAAMLYLLLSLFIKRRKLTSLSDDRNYVKGHF